PTLNAQTPALIEDIFPGNEDSSPTRFNRLGDKLIFRAETPDEGVEPWISDGTPEGTFLLKDINTDPDLSRGNSNPDNFTFYQGKFYFKARSSGFGDELWVTDGTPENTVLLKDIQEGDGNGNPFDFIVYEGKLYFTANNGTNSSELWVTDGTEEGTQLVVDIQEGGGPGNPNFKTIFQDKLFFTANDGLVGNELWMSDGTEEGTMLVKDIRDGGNASPSQYFEHNGELYFRANDGNVGTELWKTDGTEEGTVLVRDIREGSSSSSPSDFFTLGDSLFFVANDGDGKELWITGGDSASTRKFIDLNPEGASDPREIIIATENEVVVFVADTSDADNGAQFYSIFGEGGEIELFPIPEVMEDLPGADPEDVVYTGTSLYFSYESPETGREIAVYNAALDEGQALPETVPGPGGDVDDITLILNQVYFEAEDSTNGAELWGFTPLTAYVNLIPEPGAIVLQTGDTLDFGVVTPGFSSSISLNAVHTGTDPTIFLENDLEDLSAPFSGNAALLELVISPGDNILTDLLTFAPTAVGTFVDSIDIDVQALGILPNKLYLKGATAFGQLGLSAEATSINRDGELDFGDVPTGRDSTISVSLANDGVGMLVISSLGLNNGADFSAATLADTLAPGESISVEVSFSPTEIGDFRDTLTVVTNDEGGDYSIALVGTAIVNSVVEQGLPARAVFPNPANDEVTIALASPLQDGKWRIFNASGQLVSSGVWPQGLSLHQLPVRGLPSGIYHVEVSGNGGRLTAKVIKR
ncbi:MAG: ELWxxDGT repeat protein, partial [Bacteroidota bacterium]